MNFTELLDDRRLGDSPVSDRSNSKRAELIALYRKALDSQAVASEAWGSLLDAHVRNGSPWSTILHCARAAGVSLAELRAKSGASPSTLSRWSGGVVEPSRMLRVRLQKELAGLIGSAVNKMRGLASQR